jgi:hypothetical protein
MSSSEQSTTSSTCNPADNASSKVNGVRNGNAPAEARASNDPNDRSIPSDAVFGPLNPADEAATQLNLSLLSGEPPSISGPTGQDSASRNANGAAESSSDQAASSLPGSGDIASASNDNSGPSTLVNTLMEPDESKDLGIFSETSGSG